MLHTCMYKGAHARHVGTNYACAYVCTHMYICTFMYIRTCLHVWMDVCKYVPIYECMMDGWMDGWMDAKMHGCMDVWMYGFMDA